MGRIVGGVLTTTFIVMLMSCSNGEASTQINQTSEVASQENTYACPMHPEVTGKKGDKCPKCGMAMVPQKANAGSIAYYMQFTSTPGHIIPNKEVTLSLTPHKKDKPNDPVVLDTEHEKKIHLILVNDDLSWFDHIHPAYNADGSYTVKAKFPAPGKYKAFADYKPAGGDQIVDKIEIQVAGDAPPAKNFVSEKLSGKSGRYTFSLMPPSGSFLTGESSQIEGVIKKDGQPIDANTLVDYLGAKAHIVVISMSDKEYLHVHPEVVNGKFTIHTTFDKPGIYRGWIQFNGDDKLHTIDFTLNVKQGATSHTHKASIAQPSTVSGNDHSAHHH